MAAGDTILTSTPTLRDRQELVHPRPPIFVRGDGFRAIAAAIGRSHSTVSREVRRNGGRERYRAHAADEAAWRRARLVRGGQHDVRVADL